jgi:hypothetical protein
VPRRARASGVRQSLRRHGAVPQGESTGLIRIDWPARGRGAWGLRAGQRGFPFGSPHHQRAIAWRGGISGLSVTTGAGAPFSTSVPLGGQRNSRHVTRPAVSTE